MSPDAFAFVSFTAGGTGGADETGANKDTHQSPVIQLETSNCVPAIFQFSAWREAKPRTSPRGFVQSFSSLSADVHEPPSTCPTRDRRSFLFLLAISPFEDPQVSLVPYWYS